MMKCREGCETLRSRDVSDFEANDFACSTSKSVEIRWEEIELPVLKLAIENHWLGPMRQLCAAPTLMVGYLDHGPAPETFTEAEGKAAKDPAHRGDNVMARRVGVWLDLFDWCKKAVVAWEHGLDPVKSSANADT